ncbi:IS5-like element IS1301 family transposase (plasmid) [Moraxella osloensis]|uniref:IS5-like element IS1301 family transposase n=1 Tax=Faucicola osloensis TaxID=34062 RepID=A0A4P8V643_FAUOS|nr:MULTISPECIES: IS5-like element IS1301 family transposase [Pseudomonadota]MDK1671261.1 IS5-like element IS1301 family transposase [Moraxella osloensis]QCR85147.1 IS5-like element IS1301 family transposase [Moraxella osloensis]QCR87055.1 IS5-like element IS1301 family transposase [Moraxella osloensis]QHG09608.1 IS5-like element IS1301 family transposase [Moraxella osloensis]QHG10276.1 IS5-like element IS1301 family transposase [Moraxella osloensis]
MARTAITDNIWEQLQTTMKAHGCHQWKNDRTVMEAILWKLRTGAPWRDIPIELGSWKTAYNRFNRWSKKRLVAEFFFDLRKEIDKEWVFIDGSYVRCHQHASGARRGFDRAIGQSRGGNTTKIHLCVDSHGNPLDFKVTGGNVHDSQVANDLIEVIQEAQYFIADKGYDSQEIRDKAIEHGMKAIIPKRKNAKQPNPDFDSYLYKLRHLVENAFARLKQFRSIATRYEKLARNFKSMLYLACSIIHAKLN